MAETTNKTTREQVAELIGAGFTVLQVARAIGISPQAVYKHLHRHSIPLPTERAS